tara:strand:+ start:285 stop:479 length:195 start_codon:yes stop_codon:yes gene_type:complete
MEFIDIGANIKKIQKEQAMCNADFARLAGTSPQQVIRWRKNKNIKLHTLQLISRVLGVPLTKLL